MQEGEKLLKWPSGIALRFWEENHPSVDFSGFFVLLLELPNSPLVPVLLPSQGV